MASNNAGFSLPRPTDPKPMPAAGPQPALRRVFIKSYGCQMNAYDAERMADVLAPEGYVTTDAPDQADLVVLNTCNIREKAVDKVYSELGRIRELKTARAASGRPVLVAVAGCVAQAEGAEILRRAPVVDLVVGPQAYHRLPEMLRGEAGPAPIATEFEAVSKFERLQRAGRRAPRTAAAFVTVQEGCDKFCTFCVVPYTRGAEISRPVARIVDEIERLAGEGVCEVTLLGQNVNAYHGEGPDGSAWSLARLLRRVAEVPGIARLRYTTSHPGDMSDDLIAAHADLPALMPSLHLPLQAGSDRILRQMNRRHDVATYVDLVGRIRRARPDIALSSDFIVGFPGETEAEFEATLGVVRSVGYATAFTFKYSPRPGTPAADRDGQIEEVEKDRRLAALQALVLDQQTAFNRGTIGRVADVLFEKHGRFPGQITGKTPWLQAVAVEADQACIGRVLPVAITGLKSNSLSGRIVEAVPSWRIREAGA